MHKLTRDNLEVFARWTMEVVAADRFALALEANLPRTPDEGVYHALTNTAFFTLALDIYQGNAISDASDYLRAARLAGFEREGDMKEDSDIHTVTWQYTASENSAVGLKVMLHFSQDAGAACRYVKIGTKTVDDMKLLCGDELVEFQANES